MSDVPAGTIIERHHHGWHQLAYVASGLLAVETENGSWLAPPNWAVWLPADASHGLRFVCRSSLRTLYLRPNAASDLPPDNCALAVPPLLRELILRTVALGMLDQRNGVEAAMAALIVAEIDKSERPPFALPQPTSAVTRQAAALLSTASNLQVIARQVGIGARTLERRFRAETGLTPGRWQQQRRLLASLELIASGNPVKAVATDAGFASPSAYIAAFRKLFGTTPSRYFLPGGT